MTRSPGLQKGASAIGTVITLAVLAYAVFVGIQYAPLFIESRSIDSVLRTMKSSQKADPVTSESTARAKVTNLLGINQMTEMTKSLSIREFNGKITIKFSYERELDLGFKKRPMVYEKLLVLN
jgi:hypothetical protein